MKICENCKHKKPCAELPGICLKLPCIMLAAVGIMLTVFLINSTL